MYDAMIATNSDIRIIIALFGLVLMFKGYLPPVFTLVFLFLVAVMTVQAARKGFSADESGE
jgi:hypothetical protein